MKKKYFFILLIFMPWSLYSQYKKLKTFIVSGQVTQVNYNNSKVVLSDIRVLRGEYSLNTISFRYGMRENIKTGDIVIAEIHDHNNVLIVNDKVNSNFSYISPVGPVFICNKKNLNTVNFKSCQTLISEIKLLFEKMDVNDELRVKNILDIVYDKKTSLLFKYTAIKYLKNSFYSQTCFPVYAEKIRRKLYNDTTLDFRLCELANTVSGTDEYTFMNYNHNFIQKTYDTDYWLKDKNQFEYYIPLWKKGIHFCDSMINKYKMIISGYPVVKDTISLYNEDVIFFYGKIKKVSENKLKLTRIKIFNNDFAGKEIIINAYENTVFNDSLENKKVLVNAIVKNGKYYLNITDKHKGFHKLPLIPDGNNLFILTNENLQKHKINSKTNDFEKNIKEYYEILNSETKTKEKKLKENILNGKYVFMRQRSVWEFSDLSLEYDSLCWDFNDKYNFLDSLILRFGRWKQPPVPVSVTIDMLYNKSFNKNYKSKYNTNVYEFDYHKNPYQYQRLEDMLNSKNEFAQRYAIMRFQDLIKYYSGLKKTLTDRIKKYDNR